MDGPLIFCKGRLRGIRPIDAGGDAAGATLEKAMLIRQLISFVITFCVLAVGAVRVSAVGEAPSSAPVISATVTHTEGVVQIRDDETSPWRMAKVGMTFPVGGEVRTGPKSKLQFVLPPEQLITVDRLTQVKVLDAAKSSANFRSDIGMLYGRLRYDVDAGGLEHEAVIRAPSSALAVRGTTVEVTDDAFGGGVMLCRGVAEATLDNARKVTLQRGEETAGAAATQPTTRPIAYVRRIDSAAGMNCVRVNSQYQTVAGLNYSNTASTVSQSNALSDGEQTVVGYNSVASGLEAGLHTYVPGSGGGSGFGLAGATDIVNPIPGEGKLTFSLTWTGDGSTGMGLPDLDLTVVSPTGKKFSPAINPGNNNGVIVSPKGPVGPEVTAGVQTVQWTQKCPLGVYTYSVRYNGSGDPAIFTVQVMLDGKQINPVFQNSVLTELDDFVDFTISVPPDSETSAAKAKSKSKAKIAASKQPAKTVARPVVRSGAPLGLAKATPAKAR